MAAPWILPQIKDRQVNIVIINNKGGQFLSKFIDETHFVNEHNLKFSSMAEMWSLHYLQWNHIPQIIQSRENQLIEICPENSATARFNKKVINL